MRRKRFTLDQAKAVGKQLGIKRDKFDLEQFRVGLGVELEHGIVNPTTNVTNDDPLMTGKIALAHLTEFPDYYTRLAKLEGEAKSFWDSKKLKKTISGSRKCPATKHQ
jgi:DNA-directed RNA polymerase alpha subunit